MRRVRSVNSLIIIKERAAEHESELRLWNINSVSKTRQALLQLSCVVWTYGDNVLKDPGYNHPPVKSETKNKLRLQEWQIFN